MSCLIYVSKRKASFSFFVEIFTIFILVNISAIRIILLRLYYLCCVWYMYQKGKHRSHFSSRYSLFSSWSTLQRHEGESQPLATTQLPVCIQYHSYRYSIMITRYMGCRWLWWQQRWNDDITISKIATLKFQHFNPKAKMKILFRQEFIWAIFEWNDSIWNI